jgi:hypothetical protein
MSRLSRIFRFTGASFQFHYQLAQFGQNLMTGRASFEVVQVSSFGAKLAGGSHIKPRLLGEGEPGLHGGMKAAQPPWPERASAWRYREK